jgi:SAM-dependent methyltransferase
MTQSAQDWESSYRQPQPPPWDIGRPQPALAALAAQGRLAGEVLDAGCGTGEHALLLAARGARVVGIDLSETAVRAARDKAAERGVTAAFRVGDVLSAPLPPGGFDTVVDSGLFHVFSDEDRPRYVAVLHAVLRPGGACCLMCFSDREPGGWGPRRVARAEIEAAFAHGWVIESLEPAAFVIRPDSGPRSAEGWLALIRRS